MEAQQAQDVVVKRARKTKVKTSKPKSLFRLAAEHEISIAKPNEFYEKMSQPTESKLFEWMKKVKESSEEMLDQNGTSRIIEFDLNSNKWRWRTVNTTSELKEMLSKGEAAHSAFMKLRESKIREMIKSREDFFGGFGFSTDSDGLALSGSQNAFPVRPEYTPLIGTPFFKQLYLADYWEMHSKCFWYSNYSGIGKFIVDTTRNFVMGRGFSVSFGKKDQKAQDAWNAYADRTNVYEESRYWCDDFTKFGENMLKRIPTAKGMIHKAIDPSTIWEIVTDPENISDIKYYHQQYNTQYQIFSTKDAPVSKYIMNQMPPEMILHNKVNVTPYEKRGRSDLLSPLLFFKYYEDYIQSKLIRSKNEAAFIWDVTIDGSDDDVQNYITQTQSIVDVPPGSENVHNKAITRAPLTPAFGTHGVDQTANELLSYVAMAVSTPFTYFGTSLTSGSTKAGALVSTEPVAKKMVERQLKMECLLRYVIRDVLIDAKIDPKTEFEINFPEIMEEDSSQKMQNLTLAYQEKSISHRRMSEMMAKELKVTKYDYDDEQKAIEQESKNPSLFNIPDLTDGGDGGQNLGNGNLDRPDIKKQGTQI